jgi:hypothetical protein
LPFVLDGILSIGTLPLGAFGFATGVSQADAFKAG